MPHGASRLVRTVLVVAVCTPAVRAETVAIRFSELGEYARTLSPRAQWIEQEYVHAQAERDADLQWSNPELGYDREDVDILDEYQITIGKRFEVPWAYFKRRSAWSSRVQAALLQKEQSTRDHVTELKSGYVKLQLLDEYLTRLGHLKEVLTDASHVATSRHTEGQLSGVEDHLIQMSVISLNAGYQSALQERREFGAQWRAAAGLSSQDTLSLLTEIAYRAVQLESAQHYVAMLETQPGIQAQGLMQEFLAKRAGVESGLFIPALRLYGGYKKIEPDFGGYVAGFSLDIPVFNFNGASSRKFEAESRMAAAEAQMSRSLTSARITALVQSIHDARLPLAAVADHFTEDQEAFDNLLYSYEEGWLTLSELLNGIQIELAGLKDYYDQLNRYYENIFALESLTGQTLVRFAP